MSELAPGVGILEPLADEIPLQAECITSDICSSCCNEGYELCSCYTPHSASFSLPPNPINYFIPSRRIRIFSLDQPYPVTPIEQLDTCTVWRGLSSTDAEELCLWESLFRSCLERKVLLCLNCAQQSNAPNSSAAFRKTNINLPSLVMDMVVQFEQLGADYRWFSTSTDIYQQVAKFVLLHDCFTPLDFTEYRYISTSSAFQLEVRAAHSNLLPGSAFFPYIDIKSYPAQLSFENLVISPLEGQNYYLKPMYKHPLGLRAADISYTSPCDWLHFHDASSCFRGVVPRSEVELLKITVSATVKHDFTKSGPFHEQVLRAVVYIRVQPDLTYGGRECVKSFSLELPKLQSRSDVLRLQLNYADIASRIFKAPTTNRLDYCWSSRIVQAAQKRNKKPRGHAGSHSFPARARLWDSQIPRIATEKIGLLSPPFELAAMEPSIENVPKDEICSFTDYKDLSLGDFDAGTPSEVKNCTLEPSHSSSPHVNLETIDPISLQKKQYMTLFDTVRSKFRADYEEQNQKLLRRAKNSSSYDPDFSRLFLPKPRSGSASTRHASTSSTDSLSASKFQLPVEFLMDLSEEQNPHRAEHIAGASAEVVECIRQVEMIEFGSGDDIRDVRQIKKDMLARELQDLEHKMIGRRVDRWVDSDEMGSSQTDRIDESQLE